MPFFAPPVNEDRGAIRYVGRSSWTANRRRGRWSFSIRPPDPGPQALRPSAYIQADGSFALRTYFPADGVTTDGVPPGEYLVAINWYPANVRNYRSVISDKLGGRYGDPKTSGLRAQVREEPNE